MPAIPVKTRRRRCLLEGLELRRLLTTTTFVPGAEYAPANGVAGIAVADLDNDGRPDVVTVSGDDGAGVQSTLEVRLGVLGGGFSAPLDFTVGIDAESVVAADITGDGIPDLLTVDSRGSAVDVLIGVGNGTFRTGPSILTQNPQAIVVADFNGDKIADLAIAEEGFGETGGDVQVLLGDNTGHFGSIGVTVPLSGLPATLVAGNFNFDGSPDLVAGVIGDGQVSGLFDLLINDGTAGFTKQKSQELFGLPSGAVAADLNRDGLTDLAFSTADGAEVAFGLGDGEFTDTFIITDGVAVGLAAGDFNGDGSQDIVSGGIAGPVASLSGSPSVFLDSQQVLGRIAGLFAVGDFNGDGRTDFVAASNASGFVDVYSSVLTNDPVPPPVIGGLDGGFGNGSGKVVSTIPRAQLTSLDTAVVQQGELLVVGFDPVGNQVVLTRYFSDGSLDLGFGGRAGQRTPMPAGFAARRVVINPGTNETFVLGSIAATGQPAALKLAAGGYIDESFGDSGVLAIPGLAAGDRVDVMQELMDARQVPAGLLIGGRMSVAGVGSAFVARLAVDGAVNLKFGKKGFFYAASVHGTLDTIDSLTTTKRNLIFATGVVSAGAGDATTSAILTLELSAAGKLVKPFGQQAFAFPGYALSAGQKVVLQDDGKVVVSGEIAISAATATGTQIGSVFVRYTAKGKLDTTFNNSGSLIVFPPDSQAAASVATSAVVRTAGVVTAAVSDQFTDFQSNRTAAAAALGAGKLRQDVAQASAANTVLTQSQIVADAADLSITSVSLSGKSPHKPVKSTVTLKLANPGTLALMAVSIPVTLYLSTDTTLDTAADKPIFSTTLAATTLKAGTSKSAKVTFILPAFSPGTPLYLFALADADGTAFSELTLSDNSAHTTPPFLITA